MWQENVRAEYRYPKLLFAKHFRNLSSETPLDFSGYLGIMGCISRCFRRNQNTKTWEIASEFENGSDDAFVYDFFSCKRCFALCVDSSTRVFAVSIFFFLDECQKSLFSPITALRGMNGVSVLIRQYFESD